jgi:hypothetical protein
MESINIRKADEIEKPEFIEIRKLDKIETTRKSPPPG